MSDTDRIPRCLQEARLSAGKNQREAAKLLGCTAQAISNWERGCTRIDCASLFRLLTFYDTDIYDFLERCGFTSGRVREDTPESRLLSLYRALEPRERDKLCRIAAVLSDREEPRAENGERRVIPLYRFLAAAGIPSPQPGEDYEDLAVPADSPADFAARIAGDSMEPWIHDGDTVLCRRSVDLHDGDVGIFYANDGMVCKQYYRDSEGNILLFSLNRERREADVFHSHDSDMPLVCYGQVLLDQRIPLPND